jgi:hypothetical protein
MIRLLFSKSIRSSNLGNFTYAVLDCKNRIFILGERFKLKEKKLKAK